MNTPLCEGPAEGPAGCCAAPALPAAAPIRPFNPPGLAQLAYRIGTFGSFREAMLRDLAELLPTWRGDSGLDYGTVLVELWAYVADVLTFYQERIANEAYLATAARRDSLARLAELVDYQPGPGAAATVLLAFTAARAAAVTVPVGLRVGSKPSPGRRAATFETDTAVSLRGEHSAIPVATQQVTNQFGRSDAVERRVLELLDEVEVLFQRLAAPDVVPAGVHGRIAVIRDVFRGPVTDTGLASATQAARELRDLAQEQSGASPAATQSQLSVIVLLAESYFARPMPAGRLPPQPFTFTRTVKVRGLGLRIRPGDYLLIFDTGPREGEDVEAALLRLVTGVAEDRAARATALTFKDDPAYEDPRRRAYRQADPHVYAFRATAGVFGAGAPLWSTLSPYLTQDTVAGFPNPNAPFKDRNWDDPNNRYHHVLGERTLTLDRVHDGLVPGGQEAPSWAVLVDGDSYQVFAVTGVENLTVSDYTLTSRVTRLSLESPVRPGVFGVRTATVLVQPVRLELYDLRPAPPVVGGDSLSLAGQFRHLQSGQRVVVSGRPVDAASGAAAEEDAAEDGVLKQVEADGTGFTSVTLQAPLTRGYLTSTARLMANIAPASHGETVRDEVLGSGDGTPFQGFVVRKAPLTHVQTVGAEVDAGVESTLRVTINGVLWTERRNLVGAGASDRVYVTREGDDGRTTVSVGDGVSGAVVPTGRDNVHARYRWGIGSAGNLGSHSLVQLVDRVPGLLGVDNPEPTAGGADPEAREMIQLNAPGSLRLFGRAVSVDDYTALALSFPGVARARASRPLVDRSGRPAPPAIHVTIATDNGVPIDEQVDFAGRLRAYMDARRDPNVPMRLEPSGTVAVELAVTVNVLDDRGRKAVLQRVRAALAPQRNPDGSHGLFSRLGFGEPVRLSAVYAAVQRVDGVRDAVVTRLRQKGEPVDVKDRVPVPPTSLATIAPADLEVGLGPGGISD